MFDYSIFDELDAVLENEIIIPRKYAVISGNASSRIKSFYKKTNDGIEIFNIIDNGDGSFTLEHGLYGEKPTIKEYDDIVKNSLIKFIKKFGYTETSKFRSVSHDMNSVIDDLNRANSGNRLTINDL